MAANEIIHWERGMCNMRAITGARNCGNVTRKIERINCQPCLVQANLDNTPELLTQEQFAEFRRTHDLRVDWHEPDEQGITVRIAGSKFDNAGFPGYELTVVFYKDFAIVAHVNLAMLCSWASNGDVVRLLHPELMGNTR